MGASISRRKIFGAGASFLACQVGGLDFTRAAMAGGAQLGVNVSGAEYSFGSFPSHNTLEYIQKKGIRLIRLPVAWEMLQHYLKSELDENYLNKIVEVIAFGKCIGIETIIDLHNYGRYNTDWHTGGDRAPGEGVILGSPELPVESFCDLWIKLASRLRAIPGIYGYGLMNEPHDLPNRTVWPTSAQAAVNAIRTVDRSRHILVCGDEWGTSHFWPDVNDGLKLLRDECSKLVFETHCYFDSPATGNYKSSFQQQRPYRDKNYRDNGASWDIGVRRLAIFRNWCRDNNVRGIVGEIGIPGDSSDWLKTLENALRYALESEISCLMWVFVMNEANAAHWFPTRDRENVGYKMNLAPIDGIEKAHWNVIEQLVHKR